MLKFFEIILKLLTSFELIDCSAILKQLKMILTEANLINNSKSANYPEHNRTEKIQNLAAEKHMLNICTKRKKSKKVEH